MTTGEKIATLRKTHNYTQENLAEILKVSRQSISKWESDLSFPETDKLIKLSGLFDCSVDYLLKENYNNSVTPFIPKRNRKEYEYISKKHIGGMPLVHVNVGKRKKAMGIIAVGYRAKGIVSFGIISLGVISVGIIPLGLLTFGIVALGLIAFGVVALGGLSIGTISLGIISIGAIAVGNFALGALAVGKYFALGDHATAQVALGSSLATGELYAHYTGVQNSYSGYDINQVSEYLNQVTPEYFRWIVRIITSLL